MANKQKRHKIPQNPTESHRNATKWDTFDMSQDILEKDYSSWRKTRLRAIRGAQTKKNEQSGHRKGGEIPQNSTEILQNVTLLGRNWHKNST